MKRIHDPNYPDVDPVTGDEAETEEFINSEFEGNQEESDLQKKRREQTQWHDWMME